MGCAGRLLTQYVLSACTNFTGPLARTVTRRARRGVKAGPSKLKLKVFPDTRVVLYLWRSDPQNRGNGVQTKDTVRAVLDRLPDDCSLEDVLYHLYVVQAVADGRADVEAGRTLSQQQVAEELRRKWLVAELK